jgi:hypothetical protein
MSATTPRLSVSAEALADTPFDVVQQIQRQRVDEFIEAEIARATPILGERLARELYRPTAFEVMY